MRVRGRACDVLVAGGGVAGIAAAVTCARSGARTILVEQEKVLGGIGVRGLIQSICGLYPDSARAAPGR